MQKNLRTCKLVHGQELDDIKKHQQYFLIYSIIFLFISKSFKEITISNSKEQSGKINKLESEISHLFFSYENYLFSFSFKFANVLKSQYFIFQLNKMQVMYSKFWRSHPRIIKDDLYNITRDSRYKRGYKDITFFNIFSPQEISV